MIPEKGFSSIDELQSWLETCQQETQEIKVVLTDETKSSWDRYCLTRFGKLLEDSLDDLAECQLLYLVVGQKMPPSEHGL